MNLSRYSNSSQEHKLFCRVRVRDECPKTTGKKSCWRTSTCSSKMSIRSTSITLGHCAIESTKPSMKNIGIWYQLVVRLLHQHAHSRPGARGKTPAANTLLTMIVTITMTKTEVTTTTTVETTMTTNREDANPPPPITTTCTPPTHKLQPNSSPPSTQYEPK